MKIDRIVLGPKDLLLIRTAAPLDGDVRTLNEALLGTVLEKRVIHLSGDADLTVLAAGPE